MKTMKILFLFILMVEIDQGFGELLEIESAAFLLLLIIAVFKLIILFPNMASSYFGKGCGQRGSFLSFL
ncbi:hypothetical protein [Mesobacillus foraminis]|uniref:hypothetical protein n=1 Tax=Mesobacillus foraminis TaxID=279826 RepID=UPI0018EE8BCB|nr:hypothetical protein [Mesobacillus foraminis]